MPELGNSAVFAQSDASNNSGTVPTWAEGMAAAQLNDSARALQGAITREWNWRNYTLTSGGSSNAYTLTYSVAPAALYNGQRFAFIANFANTGACTLNINSLGALSIKKDVAGVLTALTDSEIASGSFVEVAYNSAGSCFVWVNQKATFSAAQAITVSDSATNTVTDVLSLVHQTSGTAAASFGIGLKATLENASGTNKDAASIDFIWTDATAASEDSKISFKTQVAGAAKAEAVFVGAGLVVGSPTGGDKGAGTVNATGIATNGVYLGTEVILASTSVGTGTTYTISSSTITKTYRWLKLIFKGLSHGNASVRSFLIEVSGDNGSNWSAANTISQAVASSATVSGFVDIFNTDISSGNRVIATNSYDSNGSADFYSNTYLTVSVTQGPINAIRISVSSATAFDGGTVVLVGGG